ncbi:39S ribosomal protein L23, mitochondrial isoform X10 [Canis lupus familiaris]|uniref:39S ribosomal protein L23, mitochondrial isoform X10 n=1 Tax=Canis lupus familiaris TaxID=9615 RepID=UPI0018F6FB8C|nr:39S ribosomal protein L23, mitochondrial isoform X10 [Canis lupus familiaris]
MASHCFPAASACSGGFHSAWGGGGKPGLGATLQPAACLWDHHFKQPWSPASLGGPWYPLYQLGNPQLRIFRTNFFIQLVRPGTAQPEDTVQFRIPMEMTRVDLRNYLERIYNVPVAAVRTRVQHGSNRKRDYRNVRVKKPDYKVAYVQLIRMPSSILCPSGNSAALARAPSRALISGGCSVGPSRLKGHLRAARAPSSAAAVASPVPHTRARGSGLGLGRHWHILNF